MTLSHFPQRRIRVGKKSFALWSRAPTGHVAVFVHGFGGGAYSTWPDFPLLLPQEPRLAGFDFVFYGYNGLRARTTPSARTLEDFLRVLAMTPADFINPSLPGNGPRERTFRYNSFTLIAHSAGAVVARESLLHAGEAVDRESAGWLKTVQLIFFAPAHRGADVVPLNADVLSNSFALAAIQFAANFCTPIWKDLHRDSSTLKGLERRTKSAIQAAPLGRRSHLVAKHVLIGTLENVVAQEPFCDDPGPEYIEGRGHFNVCKPSSLADVPFTKVIKDLS